MTNNTPLSDSIFQTVFPGLTPSAFVFDLDGVLIDSLGLDLKVVNEILTQRFGVTVSDTVIRRNFALAVPDFWKELLRTVEVEVSDQVFDELVKQYDSIRAGAVFELCPGVEELLRSIRTRTAVASNNPDNEILQLLTSVGLADRFDEVVGFTGRRKKPEPDIFLEAARRLGVDPTNCVVFEDSVVGIRAAICAGAFCVGVATGGDTFDQLAEAGADLVIVDLTEFRCEYVRCLLTRLFPFLGVTKVSLNDSRVSLNSTNGVLMCGDRRELFFKFHTEEGEEDTIDEYYNAKMLVDAGLPVLRPLFESTTPGQQVLVYDKAEWPTMYDVSRETRDERREKELLRLETDLNRKALDVYLRTLRQVDAADQERCPLYQLFYRRLVADEGMARVDRFYGDADILEKKWTINGIPYEQTVVEIVEDAKRLLDPMRLDRVVVATGHGDDHNGNKFVTNNGLVLFDPAFAADNQSALLSFVKSTFHDTMAHPFWLYEPDKVDCDIRVGQSMGEIRIDFDLKMGAFRRASFDLKVEQVWIPLLTDLKRRGWLDNEWQDYLRKAFFCCPFLVTNLLDPLRFRPEVSIMALAKCVMLGSRPPLSRQSRDVSSLPFDPEERKALNGKSGAIKDFFYSLADSL